MALRMFRIHFRDKVVGVMASSLAKVKETILAKGLIAHGYDTKVYDTKAKCLLRGSYYLGSNRVAWCRM